MLVVAIEQKSQCGKNLRQKLGFIIYGFRVSQAHPDSR
jgi:hypothetical protein